MPEARQQAVVRLRQRVLPFFIREFFREYRRLRVITQGSQRPLKWLVTADYLLQRTGQLRNGHIIPDVKIIHPGPPGSGVVTEILFSQLTLNLCPVSVAVLHVMSDVQYPGVQRGQFHQFIALLHKVALQAVTGEKLRNNQFVVIGRCEHLLKGRPHLVAQVKICWQYAQRPRFQTLVNPLVNRQFAKFFLC